MKIAIGADHRGNPAARRIADRLKAEGHEVEVVGGYCDGPCDYPERAYSVGQEITAGRAERGVLVCGTGIGMSIAANKIYGVRAALASDEMTAQLSRSHNDANVLCLSADLLGQTLIDRILDIWLSTPFEGGRHARRVRKIEMIEAGHAPWSANASESGINPVAAGSGGTTPAA